MAGDLNKVILIGRLTRDPELSQTSTGMNYCRFSLAVNRYYTQNQEKKEEVSFLNCIAWGRQAEVIAQYCQKGKQLGVEGRLRQNTWQDKEGQKRSTVDTVVEQVQLLSAMSNREKSSTEAPEATSSGAHEAPEPSEDDIPF